MKIHRMSITSLRNQIKLITLIVVLACLILLGLVYASHKNPFVSKGNGFQRKWSKVHLSLDTSINFGNVSNRIIGLTNSSVFIIKDTPTKVFSFDYHLRVQKILDIPLLASRSILNSHEAKIDSPFYYLFSGNQAVLYKAYPFSDSLKPSQFVKISAPLITRYVQINKNFSILRSFESNRRYQQLTKASNITGRISDSLLLHDEQKDAGFSTDGMLLYDSSCGLVAYVNFYENGFFTLDTNLNLIHKARTVDTFSVNELSTKTFFENNGEGSLMPAVPLNPINYSAAVNNGFIHICSRLKADNESDEESQNNSPIDIYDLRTGQYKESYHIPDISNKKITCFMIFGRQVIAVYNGAIAIFSMLQ